MLEIVKSVPVMPKQSIDWKGEWRRYCHLAKILMIHMVVTLHGRRTGCKYELTFIQEQRVTG